MAIEIVLGVATLLLLYTFLYLRRRGHRKYEGIPMATPRFPLLGNAASLDMGRSHIMLADWAQEFGPVFRIRMFDEEILVLNDFRSIHDALVTKGSAFAGRPPMYRTSKEGRQRHSIVWQTYTSKLQFMRKEVHKSVKMYGNGGNNLQHECVPEILAMLHRFESSCGHNIDPWDSIYEAVSNIMLKLTLGISYDQSSSSFHLIKRVNYFFNDTFGSGNARGIDFLPWFSRLRCSDYSKRLQKALSLRDELWERELAVLQSHTERDCIVQRFLTIISSPKGQEMDISETTAKEVFTNLILAGTDTTATALTCLLLIFLHQPDVQEKMWKELQNIVGDSRLPTLADQASLPYFQAALLELLRYTSHVSLAIPHYTICDTSVLGIPVPKNMTVYINLWALHHNAEDWPDPWIFRPNRFLDDSGQLLPSSHPQRRRLLVFGAGRRVCLGEALAKNRLFLFAAALVQQFRFLPSTTDLESGELPPVDPRTYTMGVVLHPLRFKLRAMPRKDISLR